MREISIDSTFMKESIPRFSIDKADEHKAIPVRQEADRIIFITARSNTYQVYQELSPKFSQPIEVFAFDQCKRIYWRSETPDFNGNNVKIHDSNFSSYNELTRLYITMEMGCSCVRGCDKENCPDFFDHMKRTDSIWIRECQICGCLVKYVESEDDPDAIDKNMKVATYIEGEYFFD